MHTGTTKEAPSQTKDLTSSVSFPVDIGSYHSHITLRQRGVAPLRMLFASLVPPNRTSDAYQAVSVSGSPAQSSLAQITGTVEQPIGPVIRRVDGKANVTSACGPCKRAHLACDVGRPCKRCTNMCKEDRCEDIPVSSSDDVFAYLLSTSSITLRPVEEREKAHLELD